MSAAMAHAATRDFAKLHRFYVEVARDADPTWLAFIPDAVLGHCLNTRGGMAVLSRLLLQETGLVVPAQFHLPQPCDWLLAEQAALRHAALAIGACACGTLLRRDITREAARRAREALGETLLGEAIESDDLPEPALAKATWIAATSAPALKTLMEQAGASLLLTCLARYDDACGARLKLRFPRQFSLQAVALEDDHLARIHARANQLVRTH